MTSMRMSSYAAAGLALVLGTTAIAQEHDHDQVAASCGADTLALEGLSGWEARSPAKATPGEYDLAVAQLAVGRAVDATLRPVGEVPFVVEPERWPEPETYAGMFAFEAPVAGTYRVALSAGAWIDVVAGDKLAPSGEFGHGPGCSGIGKLVEFALEPGPHVLQLSGSPGPELAVMVGHKSGSGPGAQAAEEP